MYGTGISKIGTLLDTAFDLGIVERAGAWYSYDGERLGQGRENSKNFIAEHPDLRKKKWKVNCARLSMIWLNRREKMKQARATVKATLHPLPTIKEVKPLRWTD